MSPPIPLPRKVPPANAIKVETSHPALFDADTTVDAVCELCGATRHAGADKAEDCQHDQQAGEYAKRPAACLNAHDPRYADLPF